MTRGAKQHLRDSLLHQAAGGSWTTAFDMRPVGEDPWGIDIADPDTVHFAVPDQHAERAENLRDMLFGVVRNAFIADRAWQQTVEGYAAIFDNTDVTDFATERGANIISITPHTMFADLGITAGAAYQAMRPLDQSHPFAMDHMHPWDKQTIVAGRILTLLKYPLFSELTGGLPLLEGLMMPLAGVTTTHSANGSGVRSRLHLGHDNVKAMNSKTLDQLESMMTRGGHIIHQAPHGTQVKHNTRGYTPVRVIDPVSEGTKRLMTSLNGGEPATTKNIVLAVALDCPSIGSDGSLTAHNPNVSIVPELWVPTEPRDIDIIMRAMAAVATQYKLSGHPELRYKSVRSALSRTDRKRLQEITLTDLRDA